MSLEAIRFLSETEEKARQMKAAAAANAKKQVADARVAGEIMIEDALREAEARLAAMNADVTSQSLESAEKLARENEAAKAEMGRRAQENMPEAIAFIVERIVKG